jgi:hypothetical protein
LNTPDSRLFRNKLSNFDCPLPIKVILYACWFGAHPPHERKPWSTLSNWRKTSSDFYPYFISLRIDADHIPLPSAPLSALFSLLPYHLLYNLDLELCCLGVVNDGKSNQTCSWRTTSIELLSSSDINLYSADSEGAPPVIF